VKINYVEGDLFANIDKIEGKTIFIPHCCNNLPAWGQGFVVPLGNRFPKAKEFYLKWGKHIPKDAAEIFGKVFDLGQTQFVKVTEIDTQRVIVCNMVAQDGVGGKRPLRYNELSSCMDSVAHEIGGRWGDEKCEIHAPMFGSGLAGGNWEFIEELIKDCWLEFDIPVNVYYIPGKTPTGWVPPENN
jgi:hypothetical protein